MTNTSSKKINTRPTTSRVDLLNSIDAIASRGGISRDKALTAWYAAVVLGIDEDEAIDAASVDGPEDAGCDFIYVDDEQSTIYVLQGYLSDRSEKAAPIKKWDSLVSSISNIKDPESFLNSGRLDIYQRLQNVEIGDMSIVLGLITVAAKSDQISRKRESAFKSKAYGSNVSYIYEDQETLYDKHLVAQAATRNVPKDTIEFNGNVIDIKGDFGEAIVGTVSAAELGRLHEKYNNQLFEGNVRLFIGQRKGGINEKMIETAGNRSGEFWALNNGITIVADSFAKLKSKGNRYEVNQFSIVNGCQTTVSLSTAISKYEDAGKVQVLVRVVGAKRTLLSDIVRYNNTQNPVKISAVRLLDPIQEGLRQAFERISYIYAPKQEGARNSKSQTRIELDKIAQFLASFHDETILEAVTKKQELFDRSYKSVFYKGLTPEKVFLAWLVAQSIEAKRVALLNGIGDKQDKVMKTVLGINGTPWAIYVCSTVIDKTGIDYTRLSLEKMATLDFKNAIDKYAEFSLSLYSELAINIIDTSDSAISPKNQIRVKPFLDKLKRTMSLRLANPNVAKLPKLSVVANGGR